MVYFDFVMGPIQARLLLKALVATGRNAEFIGLQMSSSVTGESLIVRSCDNTVTCMYGFGFKTSFFDSSADFSGHMSPAFPTVIFTSKHITRMFKNVSPNKILQIKMSLSVQGVILQFTWRNGLVSQRQLRAATPPDDFTLPSWPTCGDSSTTSMMSFSPKYLHNLMQMFPDSTTLWALTISRKPGSVNSLIFSNMLHDVSSGATVELTVSQADLNRNGSFFSRTSCTFYSKSAYTKLS